MNTSRRNLWPLWAVFAVTLAPVIASYVMYYGVRPEGRVNYGDFVEPQVTLTALPVSVVVRPTVESAFAFAQDARKSPPALKTLGDWQGRWLMLHVGPATCTEACRHELWLMRQVRLTTGRERDRVERIWILTDAGEPDPAVLANQEGLWVLRLGRLPLGDTLIENWLSVALRGTTKAGSGVGNIWIVDPMGNLMMRWPDNPDPNGMKKDINRLLKASRIG